MSDVKSLEHRIETLRATLAARDQRIAELEGERDEWKRAAYTAGHVATFNYEQHYSDAPSTEPPRPIVEVDE